MEQLIGVASPDPAFRRERRRAFSDRAAARDLPVSEELEAGELLLATLRRSMEPPCRRLHADASVTLGWTGHTVHPDLELLPDASEIERVLAPAPEESIGDLGGLFAVARLERTGRLFLSADRLGLWPLYLLPTPEGLLFSTSLDLLLFAAPRQLHLDRVAAAEHLHLHYCLGTRTLTEEVQRLRQGSHAVYDLPSGRLEVITHHDLSALPAPQIEDPEEALDLLVPALERAIARRLDERRPTTCLLSSGFDSRAISAALVRAGVEFRTATTYGDTGVFDDPDGARMVAEVLGLDNHFIDLPEDYLQRLWRDKCIITDFASTMHTWLLPLARAHREEGAVALDGIAGHTVFMTQVPLSDLERVRYGDVEALVGTALERQPVGRVLEEALTPELGRQWLGLAEEGIRAEVERFAGHPASYTTYVLANRSRRAIGAAPAQLLSDRLAVVAPFIDHELLDLGFQVKPAIKADGKLYRAAIARLEPALATVPTNHDAEWPEDTPRQRLPRMSLATPAPIGSYLDEIEACRDRCPGLVRTEWLAAARASVEGQPRNRWRWISSAQALGELCYWFATYGDRVSVEI